MKKPFKMNVLMRIVGLVLFVVFVSSKSMAYETELAVECDSCTEFAATAAAISATGSSMLPERVYVFDLGGEIVRRYLVESDMESPGHTVKYTAPLPSDPEAVALFDDYVKYKNESSLEDFHVDPWVIGSAYEIIGNGQNQRAVGANIWNVRYGPADNYITRMVSNYSAIGNMMAASYRIQNAVITIKVIFEDGSLAEFKPVLKPRLDESPDMEFEYVEGTAIDSEGNSIPDNSEGLQETSGSISDANIPLFIALAQQFGFQVIGAPPPQSENQSCTFSCTTEKCTLNCQ